MQRCNCCGCDNATLVDPRTLACVCRGCAIELATDWWFQQSVDDRLEMARFEVICEEGD